MTALSDLYLTGSGRIGRRAFVVSVAPLVIGWWAVATFAPDAPDWTGIVLAAALLYFAACVTAQRLHDLGRAGWWAGLLLLGVVLAWTWRESPFGWALGVLLLAPLAGLTLKSGQAAFNRYGAPPA